MQPFILTELGPVGTGTWIAREVGIQIHSIQEAVMAITRYSVRRPTYSGWSDLDDMSNRLARFFDETMSGAGREGSWAPAMSVSETPDDLVLTAELPGMTEDNISIELENNVLSISGEKTETVSEDDKERRYHVYERRFGA